MPLTKNMMAAIVGAAWMGVLVAVSSCIIGFDGLTGGTLDAGDAGDAGDAADASDGDADAALDATDGDAADTGVPCPGDGGPSGVRIDAGGGVTFCIDSTEVTNGQYAAFFAAKGGDTSGQAPPCTDNASYAPSISGDPSRPVAGIDWCDAVAFCTWAGKRLCGKIGGGPGSITASNGTQSMWYFACSGGGAKAFPYGATYNPAVCSTNGMAQATGSQPFCVGGFPGIFDMSGNVEEWVDECADGGSPCLARGGDFADQDAAAGAAAGCVTDPSRQEPRLQADAVRGFRCCSP
jgi:formylglycine-generating enzyme required for sulfatase activity